MVSESATWVGTLPYKCDYDRPPFVIHRQLFAVEVPMSEWHRFRHVFSVVSRLRLAWTAGHVSATASYVDRFNRFIRPRVCMYARRPAPAGRSRVCMYWWSMVLVSRLYPGRSDTRIQDPDAGRGTRRAGRDARTHASTRPHEGTRKNASTPSSSVTVSHGTPATLRAHASRSPAARPPRRRARRARHVAYVPLLKPLLQLSDELSGTCNNDGTRSDAHN